MPRNYLSKRLALKICYELWTWLAKTGCKHKFDWPGWENKKSFAAHCPCCEWVRQHKKIGTVTCLRGISPGKYCPLKSLWPEGCQNYGQKTAWDIWRSRNSIEIRKQQAQIIADAAYKEWQKLEK